MVAPISVSGAMTRRIGRRVSDASPMMVVRNGCAAASPDSSRIVVPELAASTGPAAAVRPWRPRPVISTSAPRFCDRDAEGAQAGEGRRAVGAGGIAGDMRGALGDGAEQCVAM